MYIVMLAAILVWKMRLSNIFLQRIMSMQEKEHLRQPHLLHFRIELIL